MDRHQHHPDIGVDGAERVILGLDTRLGSALNSVDLPTFGKPTIPHLRDIMTFQLNFYGGFARCSQLPYSNGHRRIIRHLTSPLTAAGASR